MCHQKKLLNFNEDELVIIVESLYYKEIVKDLNSIGLTNTMRIFRRGGGEKFEVFKNTEEWDTEFDEKMQQVKSYLVDEKSSKVMECIISSWKTIIREEDFFEKIYDKNQYFDSEVLKINENEVFVDVGAYTGDTAMKFLEFCKGKFEKMHLFELNPTIFKELCSNVKRMDKDIEDKITCYPYGLADKDSEVYFEEGDSGSTIVDFGENLQTGKVKTLDSILGNEKVTFIKMDIEGSELEALKGAENLIKQQKPKLAICIYHKMEDLHEIPLYIKKLVPEYKLYVRHYTDMMLETVCYAIPKD